MPELTRRTVLLAGGALALAGCGVDLPGGSPKASGSFRSAAMAGREVGWAIAYPKGHEVGANLPVVVSLHGRGGNHGSSFGSQNLDGILDDVVKAGASPFAIAAVDGGDHGYWHRRTDGTDAGAMVREDFLPLLARRGLDVNRLGLYGWSMGGYGAMLLAGKENLPVRGVAVSSPALFPSAGTTPAGAYDSREDYAAHDVYGHPEWLDGVALRVDCGTSDPFYPPTRTFVGELAQHPAGGFTAGGHNAEYWRRVAPDQLRFLAEKLSGA